jgi:hypothetical protein
MPVISCSMCGDVTGQKSCTLRGRSVADRLKGGFVVIRCKGVVPDRRRRDNPKVVVARRGVFGVGEVGRGRVGRGLGQGRSVYKQPGTEVDGSCHS